MDNGTLTTFNDFVKVVTKFDNAKSPEPSKLATLAQIPAERPRHLGAAMPTFSAPTVFARKTSLKRKRSEEGERSFAPPKRPRGPTPATTAANETYTRLGMEKFQEARKDAVKCMKGLRFLTVKVCQKLALLGTTTLKDLSEALVDDLMRGAGEDVKRDKVQKNVDRRLYDSLNVLAEINIITKEKSKKNEFIFWKGLNNSSTDQRTEVLSTVQKKQRELEELALQFMVLKNIMDRNRKLKSDSESEVKRLTLPFIVVHSSGNIECHMSKDRRQVNFSYSSDFKIHQNSRILRLLGKQTVKLEDFQENHALFPPLLHELLPNLFPSSPMAPAKSRNELEIARAESSASNALVALLAGNRSSQETESL